MTIEDVKIIDLPKILDVRGNLSYVENCNQIPFEIKRTYWLYDVPGGECRGGHAYKENEEFIIALSGAFDVTVDDGRQRKTFHLNRSYYGLYIPKGLWRVMENFSTNSFALEFGSTGYNPVDYIRDYDAFCSWKSRKAEQMTPASDDAHPNQQASAFIHASHGTITLNNVFGCSLVEFDKHHSDRKGNLSVVENGNTLPFDVKRVYYLYDVPGGESRGAHAHKKLEQLIIAISGSFCVTLDDGQCKRSFFLNRPYQGLYVKSGMWRDLDDFSSGAVCMVLASEVYKQEDYIRVYDDFLTFRDMVK